MITSKLDISRHLLTLRAFSSKKSIIFRCLETTQPVDIESCLVSYVEEQLKCKIPMGEDIASDGVCNTAEQFKEYERIYRIIQGK